MAYGSVGLRAPYIPTYFDRAEHPQTTTVYSDVPCAASSPSLAKQSEMAGASYSKVCDTEGSAWETTAWKTYYDTM